MHLFIVSFAFMHDSNGDKNDITSNAESLGLDLHIAQIGQSVANDSSLLQCKASIDVDQI